MKARHQNPVPIWLSVHDSTQIELKTLYRLLEGKSPESVHYTQEVYFFIPRSMGVNHETYPKDLFYRSLTNYIRIKTPKFLGDEERHHCRLDRIMPRLNQAMTFELKPTSVSGSVSEIRLFGAYINDQLKVLSSYHDVSEIRRGLEDLTHLMAAYRHMMDTIVPKLEGEKWHPLRQAFSYIDEFLSNRLEECLVYFHKKKVDCQEFMKAEFERRDRMGYLQVLAKDRTETQNERAHEMFAFRMGRFKKYISEVLYLEIKRVKHERFFTNMAAMGGAAAAAIINSLADPNQRTSISGQFLHNLTASLPLMIMVVAMVYVFKDRMKDVLKDYLLVWLKPWLPDYSFKIQYRRGKIIGKCQEEMNFLDQNKLSQDIKHVRDYQREIILPSDVFEEVLYYCRRMTLNRKALESIYRNTNSLKDILRFDFNHLLAKLGNPVKSEEFIDRNFNLNNAQLPKVYHINLVIKHQAISADETLATNYTRARIILDKSGIKRIENVELGSEPSVGVYLDEDFFGDEDEAA